MADPLHQINLTYDPGEDRLLLKIVTTGRAAYRLWLTRRVTGQIYEVLNDVADSRASEAAGAAASSARARDAVRDFQREDAVARVDRSKPFDDAGAELPLGGTPILIARARPGEGDGPGRLVLEAEGKPAITLGLEADLVHTLGELLANGASRAGWDLPGMTLDDEVKPPPGTGQSVH